MICLEVIKRNSTNVEAVKAVKVRLNALMKSGLDVQNGSFGPSTEAAVKAFQKSRNLIQDGEVGQLTWERLFTIAPVVKVESFDRNIRVMELLLKQLSVREATNHNDGEEVEKFLKSVGLGKGYAWCMAVVYWAHSEVARELKIPILTPKTAGVLDCLRKAKKYVVTDPQPGDQFIMDFGGGKGHTGVVTRIKDKYIYTVEGNTSADPTYAGEDREGNGMFERVRAKSSIVAYIRYV